MRSLAHTPSHLRALACLATLAAASLVGQEALAQPKTPVQVLVAQASAKEGAIAPELKGMAADLQKNGMGHLKSFKLVNQASLQLGIGESSVVKLPNGSVTVTLSKLEAGAALVKVAVQKMSPAPEFKMMPGSEFYVGAGPSGPDMIFLAVKR